MTHSLENTTEISPYFLEQLVKKAGLRDEGTSTILATEAMALALQALGLEAKVIYKQVKFGIYEIGGESQENSVVQKSIYIAALVVDENLYHLSSQMTPSSWEAILLLGHQEFVSQEKTKNSLNDNQGYETSVVSTTDTLPKFKDAKVANEKIKNLTEHILTIISSLKSTTEKPNQPLMEGHDQDFSQSTPVQCIEDQFGADFLKKVIQISPRYYLDKKKLPVLMRRISGVAGLYDNHPPKTLYVVDSFYKGDLCIQGDTAYLLPDHLDKAVAVMKPGQRDDILIRQGRDILEKQQNPSSERWTHITESAELTLDKDDPYRKIEPYQLDRSEKEILAAYQALILNMRSPIHDQAKNQKALRL